MHQKHGGVCKEQILQEIQTDLDTPTQEALIAPVGPKQIK